MARTKRSLGLLANYDNSRLLQYRSVSPYEMAVLDKSHCCLILLRNRPLAKRIPPCPKRITLTCSCS